MPHARIRRGRIRIHAGPRPASDCQRLAARLGEERARIDAAIADLAASRAALDEVIAATTTPG
jgi:hypothetical protein